MPRASQLPLWALLPLAASDPLALLEGSRAGLITARTDLDDPPGADADGR